MGNNTKAPILFKEKPLFGMDIGNGSLKVAQTEKGPKNTTAGVPALNLFKLIGYGNNRFDPIAVSNGVIVHPEIIAESANKLFREQLYGDITTSRLAMTIPSYRSYTRSITMPKLTKKELKDAINMEAEQYIPIPIDNLYIDYKIIRTNSDNTEEILIVAINKDIIDSYIDLAAILGLEVVLIETTMSSAVRLFHNDYSNSEPTIIIDFGSLSSDISISIKGVMLTSSTVEGGGEIFTRNIAKGLNVSIDEAHIIKTKYGLGVSKRQSEVVSSLSKTLEQLVKEIQRLIRYYEENYGSNSTIQQLITLGGGSNMPGLNEYLTDKLRLAVRPCDPWEYLQINKLKLPLRADKLMYATAIGLSMAESSEVF